jgi:hypothetical protein
MDDKQQCYHLFSLYGVGRMFKDINFNGKITDKAGFFTMFENCLEIVIAYLL